MFEIGFSEILVIMAIALIVLGPEKLPRLASQVGRWIGRAKAMARQFREQLEEEANKLDLAKDLKKNLDVSLEDPPRPTPPPPAESVSPEPVMASEPIVAPEPVLRGDEPQSTESIPEAQPLHGQEPIVHRLDPAVASESLTSHEPVAERELHAETHAPASVDSDHERRH